MSPLDALSALTHVSLPTTGALNAAGPGANAVPLGQTAPVSEGFSHMLSPMSENPGVGAAAASATPAATGAAGPTTWGHMVQQMVMDVNSQQQNATAMVSDVLKGGSTPVHQAMVATEEASLSFQMMAEMRNKLVDAYQQIMQMQV